MQAIAKTIEALRGIARWGTGNMLEAAFSGFTALPPPASAPATPAAPVRRDWWDVLGCARNAPFETIKTNYRRLAAAYHPDRGGDSARMAEINTARDQAMKERS